MDIKDFILIGGGMLIAAVVAHGLWIAWRARRDPLRLDLVTELPPADQDADDVKHLRGELPNGGRSRLVRQPEQGDLALGRGRTGEAEAEPGATAVRGKREPSLGTSAADGPDRVGRPAETDRSAVVQAEAARSEPVTAEPVDTKPVEAEPVDARPVRAEPVQAERPRRAAEPAGQRRRPTRKPAGEGASRAAGRSAATDAPASRKPDELPDELIVINVLAPKGRPFQGPGVVEALRGRGLRYGSMNIFHRVDPMTRASLYGVANVVEPGTFDMSDLENFRSPGICFFMRLPGPEEPMDAFEDMLKVARDLAVRVDGELKDEQRSVMTGQTVEHYRQRISDFCRRRMSVRA